MQVDPNSTDRVTVQIPIDTSGLDVDEWRKMIRDIHHRYERFRFVGSSVGAVRTADKTLVSTQTATAHTTLSIVNQRQSRMRSTTDAYNTFSAIIGNEMGMDRSANVHEIGSGYNALSHFKVPSTVMKQQWKLAAGALLTEELPTWITGQNNRELMEFFFPDGYVVPTAANDRTNVPASILVQVDSFPRTPVPPAVTGSTVSTVTGFSVTVYKNFYFQAAGIDVNGNL